MGQNGSQLTEEQVEEMRSVTNFSDKEIKRLFKRFNRLDRNGDGKITYEEFLYIPELSVNPLVNRVIAVFDQNNDRKVNFKEFISALSIFSAKGGKQDKLEFAFKIYDLDGDGFITNRELFEVLKMMVGSNLSDVQLQQIVDKTILEADEDGDGKISFQDFAKILSHADFESKMTIDF